MDNVVAVRISGLCDRVVDFIDLIEKGRWSYVVIVDIRIGGCR